MKWFSELFTIDMIDNNSNNESVFIGRTNYLRGVFAILIVLGHCSMRFETEPLILMLIHKANFLWVCFFLYVSGWSLAYNYEHRENYLNGFLKHKVMKLLLLGLEAEIIGRFLKCIILREHFEFNIKILTGWNWYIYECLLLYILFYLAYKYISNTKMLLVVVWASSFLLAVVFWGLYNWGNWEGWTFAYYYSTLSFPLGISQHYIVKGNKYTKKNICKISMIALVCSVVSLICVTLPQKSFIGGVVLHNVLGCGFLILLTFILFIVDLKQIKGIRFLTRYSTNIYLYQFCIMTIVTTIYQMYNTSIDGIYVLVVVFLIIILAIFMEHFNLLITKIIKK